MAIAPGSTNSVVAVGASSEHAWTSTLPAVDAVAETLNNAPEVVALTPVAPATEIFFVTRAFTVTLLATTTGSMNCQRPVPAASEAAVDGAVVGVEGTVVDEVEGVVELVGVEVVVVDVWESRTAGASVVGGPLALVVWPGTVGFVATGGGVVTLHASTALTLCVGLIEAPPPGWISKWR